MRIIVVLLTSICAYPAVVAAQRRPPEKSERIAAEQHCDATGLPQHVAAAVAASYAVLHDGKDCLVAFFRDLEKQGTPLEIISSLNSRRWRYEKVALKEDDRSPIASIQLEGNLIVVSLLYSMDDYAIPILTTELKLLGTIYGRFTRSWPNGLLEYTLHHPHFAPQFFEVGVFDPSTGSDRAIYTASEPCDPSRQDFVREYEMAIGNNGAGQQYCFAEWRGLAPWYYDWQTNTFAFAIELFYNYAEFPKWDKRAELMVTCDGLASINTIKCHETALDTWKTRRPDLDLTQLVAFAASQPRFR